MALSGINTSEVQPFINGVAVAAGAAGAAGATNNNNTDQAAQQQLLLDQEAQANAGPFGCFVWLCQGSTPFTSKLQFIVWIVLGILSPIFYGIYINLDDEGATLNWGYFLCAALSIVLSSYATCNFGNIQELRKAVTDLSEEVDKLNEIRTQIKDGIDNLVTVKDKLAQIEEEYSITNAQLRAQEKQFREWSQDTFKVTKENDKVTIEIKRNLEQNIRQTQRQIILAEKSIIYNALKAFENEDDQTKGLNAREFVSFKRNLPKRYRDRIGNFEDFKKTGNIIQHKDLTEELDKIVDGKIEDLSQNVGIDVPERDAGVTQFFEQDEEKTGSS